MEPVETFQLLTRYKLRSLVHTCTKHLPVPTCHTSTNPAIMCMCVWGST